MTQAETSSTLKKEVPKHKHALARQIQRRIKKFKRSFTPRQYYKR